MFRQWISCLATPAVALAAFLTVADTAAAQQFGGRGGSAFGPGFGGRSGFNSGYSPYFGNANGGWNSQSYGYQSQYPQSSGYGYYRPQGYFNNRGFLPGAYGFVSDYYPSELSGTYGEPRRISAYQPDDQGAARINVQVPATAELWVDGTKTTQRGERRQYISPPLNAGQEYSYEVRAAWTENGQAVDQTRKVRFQAGDSVTVNFTTSPPQGANATGQREDSGLVPSRTEEPRQPTTRDLYPRRTSTTPIEAVKTPANPDDAVRQSEIRTHDGKMVSLAADKLVMTESSDSKQHSHALTAGVKITCDGKACQRDDLRAGMKVRVTTKQDDQQTVTRIDALDQQNEFEKRAQ